MTIPLFKVLMTEKAKQNALEVLSSGYIAQGQKVEDFEKWLTLHAFGLVSDRAIVTVNSGTSAIDLALHLSNIEPGDEVITTPQTCLATNIHLAHRKASIVWADIDPNSGLISPTDVAKKFTKKTKAIIAVDWAGAMCDYVQLRKIAGKVPIIEDAAHAFGAHWANQNVGNSRATYVCFSFQAIKHLTTGDGGAIVVPKAQEARAKSLRWFGLDRSQPESDRFKQDMPEPGFKYHMNDIAAAIGLGNGRAALDAVGAHRQNAFYYDQRLDHRWSQYLLGKSHSFGRSGSSFWLYSIFVNDPAPFTKFMARRGINVSQAHTRNDTHTGLQKYIKPLKYDLKGVEWFNSHQINIPCGWWVTKQDREIIANAVEDWALGKI